MAFSRKHASSPTTDTFERDRQQDRELTQQRVRDYAQNFGAAGNLYGLLQPRLPPVGLFAPPRPSVHPPLHPNRDNSKRKRVDFVDLTSDADDTSAELQPHPVKRPRPSPPESAPQPGRKTKKQPIGANGKKAQDEQEAQLTADARLARELQEAELRNGKSRRLRNKTRSPEKRLDKKLSVYEEFQRIEEEAVQREQRQRSLRIASPEKRSLRTLRSSSPEKQPDKKLSTYEEFQKIQQEAAQGKHSSKKLRKSQQEAAQGKHPSKKLSVYEEFQKIQQEAAQGQSTQTRKRTLRSASPDKSTVRTRRGSTREGRRASKQNTRATMDRVNSTEDANTSQEQLRTQSCAPASADEDRRRMPPPPPPKNTTGHPMLSAQNINGNIISKNAQSRPINPLNPPVQLPTSQGILHRSKSARVTKQSYHTAHKQPYSTQETQRLAQLHEAHAHAQERARQEQKQKEEYIFRHTRPREALHHGVHMLDAELDHVAFDMCQYFDSTDYRYGHLPSVNPDLPFPSIEDTDLTAVNEGDESASVLGPTREDAPDLGDEPAGPENFIDLTNPDSERNEQEPTPLFDAPVPHERFINAYELPAYNPITASDSDFFTVGAGHETGTFLEPEWDEDDSCWRAPDTDVSQEGALVGELLQYAEEEKTSQSTDEASGWI